MAAAVRGSWGKEESHRAVGEARECDHKCDHAGLKFLVGICMGSNGSWCHGKKAMGSETVGERKKLGGGGGAGEFDR